MKIHTQTDQIIEHWNKLQKINPNEIKMLNLNGSFLTEVMNDERGEELGEKAKAIEN